MSYLQQPHGLKLTEAVQGLFSLFCLFGSSDPDVTVMMHQGPEIYFSNFIAAIIVVQA